MTFPDLGTNYATPGQGPVIYTQTMGRAMAVRSEYNLGPQNNGYPDSPTSLPLNAPAVMNQTWNYNTMTTTGFSPSHPYQTVYGKQPPSVNNFLSVNQTPCGLSGYIKPITSEFSTGTQ